MGRFLRLANPQFLQGTMYRAPYELMAKVLENDNHLRATIEAKNDALEQQILTTPSLDFDKALLNEIVEGYNSQFQDIANSIYNDVNLTDNALKKMKALQKKLLLDRLTGDYGAITNRYNAMQQFNELNKELAKEDPYTYNVAKAKMYNDLLEGSKNDPKYYKQAKSYVAEQDVIKMINEVIKDLKTSSRTFRDGNGYLRKVEELTPQEITEMAIAVVQNNPKVKAYMMQAKELGIPGFFNEDGTAISPVSYKNDKGETLTLEQVLALSPEEKKKVTRTTNSNWRYGSAISGYAGPKSYYNEEYNTDQAYFNALNYNLELEKLNFEKKKHQDKLDGLLGGEGSSSGSKGSKTASEDLGYELDGGGEVVSSLLNMNESNYQDDIANYNYNSYSKANINAILQMLDEGNIIKNINTGLSDKGAVPVIKEFIRHGVDFNNILSVANRPKLMSAIESLIKKGLFGVNGQFAGVNISDLNLKGEETISEIVSQVEELLEDNNISDVVNSKISKFYQDKNNTASLETFKAISPDTARDISYSVLNNMGMYNIYEVDNSGKKVLLDDEGKKRVISNLFNKGVKKKMNYAPTSNSSYGDAIMVTTKPTEEDNNVRRYIILDNEGKGFGNNTFTNSVEKRLTRRGYVHDQETINSLTDNKVLQQIQAGIVNNQEVVIDKENLNNFVYKSTGYLSSGIGLKSISLEPTLSGYVINYLMEDGNKYSEPLRVETSDYKGIDTQIRQDISTLVLHKLKQ